MAEQNSQTSSEISHEIKLNEVFVGKRRLRYIYLYMPNTVSTKFDKDKQCMPLFLGCDVLDGCSVSSTGNLPRFHAQHAQRGLATKVNFQSGVRIIGIHGTTRGVWFYSIQGLFKIAFENYLREEQSDCLFKLRDVWQRQISDPVLTTEVHVLFKDNTEIKTSCSSTTKPVECVDGGIDSRTLSSLDQFVYQINKTIDSFVCESNRNLQHKIKLLKTYLLYMSHKESPDSFVKRTINLIDNCLKVLPTISEKPEFSDSSPREDTHKYLEKDASYNNSLSSDRLFPASQNTANSVDQTSSDKQNISSKEVVLLEIAKWLGIEFLNYNAEVTERVTCFKQRNICSIGNLPSAENLVREVFPFSMQVFLCSWLQVPLTKNESDINAAGSDSRLNLFPVIQLILELANQSLVSGVAHVLFSQLVQSDSVQ